MPETITTQVLIVGGGTGGTCAALQAARRGIQTTLVSEFSWLGGMLTSAGVAVPDGNELIALQTGLWGQYIQTLRQKQPGGLDRSWVSLFSYHPRIGAEIFAHWVQALPNLQWITGQVPLAVQKTQNRITGVRFPDYEITAQITLDGTELGDLLPLADIPYRWGWELQQEFNEPSAPQAWNDLTQRYPVQSPTWVVLLQDYQDNAPKIPCPPKDSSEQFHGAWDNYGGESFLNYGRLTDHLYMLNWPIHGNDYAENLNRLVESETAKQEYYQEAQWHSQSFARYIQTHLSPRYGLAADAFPAPSQGAFALHPYFRESRRLQGQITVTEKMILPQSGGRVAALPTDTQGQVTAIAVGNYANDHHYPGVDFHLQPKSMRWGGRWTGTPFALPISALIPDTVAGFLVCEKNISVSHLANGATRLQPIVMSLGQAAGMMAALCVELGCQPQELAVRQVQEALITDPLAPMAVIPLLNLPPSHPDWQEWQR
ncbi:MAG: FAD-dependent oxidoreductase, partial [Kamptonema sp. SIO4C4]|nr:FAD-dependent oxidoreductase [Kamptonema sp. SIO4C4]